MLAEKDLDPADWTSTNRVAKTCAKPYMELEGAIQIFVVMHCNLYTSKFCSSFVMVLTYANTSVSFLFLS